MFLEFDRLRLPYSGTIEWYTDRDMVTQPLTSSREYAWGANPAPTPNRISPTYSLGYWIVMPYTQY